MVGQSPGYVGLERRTSGVSELSLVVPGPAALAIWRASAQASIPALARGMGPAVSALRDFSLLRNTDKRLVLTGRSFRQGLQSQTGVWGEPRLCLCDHQQEDLSGVPHCKVGVVVVPVMSLQ